MTLEAEDELLQMPQRFGPRNGHSNGLKALLVLRSVFCLNWMKRFRMSDTSKQTHQMTNDVEPSSFLNLIELCSSVRCFFAPDDLVDPDRCDDDWISDTAGLALGDWSSTG